MAIGLVGFRELDLFRHGSKQMALKRLSRVVICGLLLRKLGGGVAK